VSFNAHGFCYVSKLKSSASYKTLITGRVLELSKSIKTTARDANFESAENARFWHTVIYLQTQKKSRKF
jgi:hypothetical protein